MLLNKYTETVNSLFDGKNVIFALIGQTSSGIIAKYMNKVSGKSTTLFGNTSKKAEYAKNMKGLAEQFVEEFFNNKSSGEVQLKLRFLQVFNETIFDLLKKV